MGRGSGAARAAAPLGPPNERLTVLLHRRAVAVLERDASGHLGLAYLPGLADGDALSLSLPVRAEQYDEAALMPFFEGLLPEGRLREQLAVANRLEPTDVFALLREFGRECAGAVTITPEGEAAAAFTSEVRWLSDGELAQKINDLEIRPLADEPAVNVRISMAGAQPKLIVVIDPDGRVGLPLGATPSTHILKPQPQTMRGRLLAYPDLVANEAFCMALAAGAGIATAEITVRRVAADPVLVVRRYDRSPDGQRLHQEDFAQALGIPSRRKYERPDGPGQRDYLQLLRQHSADPLADLPALMDRVAFSYLIGNDDMHAKNHSILYRPQPRLAPAYDLVCTHVYAHLTREMGSAVNSMYDAEQLRAVHWRKHFRQIDLSEDLYARRLTELAARVTAAIPHARERIAEWNVETTLLDRIVEVVARRAARMRELTA